MCVWCVLLGGADASDAGVSVLMGEVMEVCLCGIGGAVVCLFVK